MISTDSIPQELKQYDRWVVWDYAKTKKGKPTKEPYQARAAGKLRASTNEDSHWTTFEDAAKRQPLGFAGVGFVLTGSDYISLDLDGCIRDDGELYPWATTIIKGCGCYAEISPSGAGVRIIGKADVMLPNASDHSQRWQPNVEHSGDKFEVAVQVGGYVTLTGNVIEGSTSVDVDIATYVTRMVTRLDEKEPKADTQPQSGATRDVDPLFIESLLRKCESADDRSAEDYHLCCVAIERCWDKEQVWSRCEGVGKFAEEGRRYFDLTWRNAERATGPQVASEPQPYTIGNVRLVPGKTRKTSKRTMIELDVISHGEQVDSITLTTADSNRSRAVKSISTYVEGLSKEMAEAHVQRALGRIIVAAKKQDSAKPTGNTIRDIVNATVPDLVQVTSADGVKVHSETYGELTKPTFLERMKTSALMEACEAACDAPRDDYGSVLWQSLFTAVNKALEILWADILDETPQESQFDNLATVIIQAFQTVKTIRDAEGQVITASMASLAAQHRPPTDRWVKLHPAYDAWVRGIDVDGEIVPHIGMRFGLLHQCGVTFTSVKTHKQFAARCLKHGVSVHPEVPTKLFGNVTLMVLNPSVTDQIFGVGR